MARALARAPADEVELPGRAASFDFGEQGTWPRNRPNSRVSRPGAGQAAVQAIASKSDSRPAAGPPASTSEPAGESSDGAPAALAESAQPASAAQALPMVDSPGNGTPPPRAIARAPRSSAERGTGSVVPALQVTPAPSAMDATKGFTDDGSTPVAPTYAAPASTQATLTPAPAAVAAPRLRRLSVRPPTVPSSARAGTDAPVPSAAIAGPVSDADLGNVALAASAVAMPMVARAAGAPERATTSPGHAATARAVLPRVAATPVARSGAAAATLKLARDDLPPALSATPRPTSPATPATPSPRAAPPPTPPATPPSTPPATPRPTPTVSSAPAAVAGATVPSTVARAPATPSAGLTQKLGAAAIDELYEGLIGRLRRELLLERERSGSLYGL